MKENEIKLTKTILDIVYVSFASIASILLLIDGFANLINGIKFLRENFVPYGTLTLFLGIMELVVSCSMIGFVIYYVISLFNKKELKKEYAISILVKSLMALLMFVVAFIAITTFYNSSSVVVTAVFTMIFSILLFITSFPNILKVNDQAKNIIKIISTVIFFITSICYLIMINTVLTIVAIVLFLIVDVTLCIFNALFDFVFVNNKENINTIENNQNNDTKEVKEDTKENINSENKTL